MPQVYGTSSQISPEPDFSPTLNFFEQMISGTYSKLDKQTQKTLVEIQENLTEAKSKYEATHDSEDLRKIEENYDQIANVLTDNKTATLLGLNQNGVKNLKKYIEETFDNYKAKFPLVAASPVSSLLEKPFGLSASNQTQGIFSRNTSTYPPILNPTQDANLIKFLTDPSVNGVAYTATAGKLNGITLPLSYQTTNGLRPFWENYVPGLIHNGKSIEENLRVQDGYNPAIGGIGPLDINSVGATLQIERTIVASGADIYDASVAQIAGALSGKSDFVNGINTWHSEAYDGNEEGPKGQNRVPDGKFGEYHYQGVGQPAGAPTNPDNGYLYAIIPRKGQTTDPLTGNPNITGPNAGQCMWLVDKPITGENAWASLIGPLQSEQILAKNKGQSYCDFTEGVQNAMNMLPALRSMQSPEGPIFYAVNGTEDADPHEVSVENNASTLSGLFIMQKVLEEELDNPQLTESQKNQINDALKNVSIIIYGGGEDQAHQTKGILSFFKNDAFYGDLATGNLGIFQGGRAKTKFDGPGVADWQSCGSVAPKAVDCQTWAISALGQPWIDANKGYGASYQIFQNMLNWGGYYDASGTLKGVGYSDRDGNGIGKKPGAVLSGEWTAGAINACRCLIQQYSTSPTNDPVKQQQMITTLKKQEQDMVSGLMSLRVDNYTNDPSYKEVRPEGFENFGLDPNSFLYASTRVAIPFGWNANPLPSTASTGWVKMLNENFNPLAADGSYDSQSVM